MEGLSGMSASAHKLTGRGGGPEPLWALQGEEVPQNGFFIKTGLRKAADSVVSLIHAEVAHQISKSVFSPSSQKNLLPSHPFWSPSSSTFCLCVIAYASPPTPRQNACLPTPPFLPMKYEMSFQALVQMAFPPRSV